MANVAAWTEVKIRAAVPADAEVCGRICYEAFTAIAERHGYPKEFPSSEVSTGLLQMMFTHPGFSGFVAEVGERVVGSNCLDERTAIAGVGPITITVDEQNQGAGRLLMKAVMDRAEERGFVGVRLVQAAYHNRSLSLYTKLGFVTREPLSAMQGPAVRRVIPGFTVRKAVTADMEAANAVCYRVHGHTRAGELADGVAQGSAMVVERGGRITGYASGFGYLGHAVAESNPDLLAMLSATEDFGLPAMLVPTRNTEVFRWCLENGLRVVQPMTLMSVGLYNEPAGAWLPSILY